MLIKFSLNPSGQGDVLFGMLFSAFLSLLLVRGASNMFAWSKGSVSELMLFKKGSISDWCGS